MSENERLTQHDEGMWLPQQTTPSSRNFTLATGGGAIYLAKGGETIISLEKDGVILVRGKACADAEIVAALREWLLANRR